MRIYFIKTVLFFFLALALGGIVYDGLRYFYAPKTPAETAVRIKDTYEKHLNELSWEKRGHFVLRLYRSSGDSRYLPEIKKYSERLLSKFREYIEGLNLSGYAEERGRKMLALPEHPQTKHIQRYEVLSSHAEMLFATRLTFVMTQIQSLGLEVALPEEFKRGREYLQKFSWREFLLDPKVIRVYASRTSNMVYYLKDLGLIDLENEYLEKIKDSFEHPQSEVQAPVELLNEIYGLTHVVIADSRYYQRQIEIKKYAWIFEAFTHRLEEIMERTTPDVVAEVAVCFRLAGEPDHDVVLTVQKHLVSRFNPWQNLIPSSKKKRKTWNDLEHRNILAYLALAEYEQFFAGPNLSSHHNPSETLVAQ